MVRLFCGKRPFLDTRRVEVVVAEGAHVLLEHYGSFHELGSWSPKHGGFTVAPGAAEVFSLLPDGFESFPKGVRNLELRGQGQEPLRVGYYRDEETCHYNCGELFFRHDGAGRMSLVNAGAVVGRLEPSGFRAWGEDEPFPRLLVAEWGTPPLVATFSPQLPRRQSGLAAR